MVWAAAWPGPVCPETGVTTQVMPLESVHWTVPWLDQEVLTTRVDVVAEGTEPLPELPQSQAAMENMTAGTVMALAIFRRFGATDRLEGLAGDFI
jgi:hypothetical protein